MVKKIRSLILKIWLFTVFAFGVYIFFHREFLHPQYLLEVFRSFGTWAIVIYIFVSMFRSIILLPSLPLVIVGTIYAPNMPNTVYFISMACIWFSGILVYHFSHLLGFDAMFSHHIHDPKIKKSIDTYGAFVISFWSFFPLLPVDVACYLAGTVRLNFIKFIIALTIGEWTVVAIIVYGWSKMMKLFWI